MKVINTNWLFQITTWPFQSSCQPWPFPTQGHRFCQPQPRHNDFLLLRLSQFQEQRTSKKEEKTEEEKIRNKEKIARLRLAAIAIEIFYALYSMHSILFIALYSFYFINYILYIVFYALYSMHCIIWILTYALYYML